MKTSPLLDPSSGRLLPLASLRFFAVAYVVLFHWMLMVPIRPRSGFLFRLLPLGSISISFFYLFSGYILAWVYLRRHEKIDKRRFYVARFARVYPVFLVTLLADVPWYYLSHNSQLGLHEGLIKTAAKFIGCLFMLQAWAPRFWGMDFPNWSLSVETLCYLLFPFVGVLLWRLRGMWIYITMILVYVLGQSALVYAAIFSTAHQLNTEELLYCPPLHVSTFLVGILLARLQVSSIDKSGEIPVRPAKIYVALAASVATYLAIGEFIPGAYFTQYANRAILTDGLLAPVFCVVIWGLSSGSTIPSRLLSAKWLVISGEFGYGLYLIHFPVLNAAAPAIGNLLHGTAHARFGAIYLTSFFAYFALCTLLSIASYFWIEAPARRWIKRTLTSPPRQASEAAFKPHYAGGAGLLVENHSQWSGSPARRGIDHS